MARDGPARRAHVVTPRFRQAEYLWNDTVDCTLFFVDIFSMK
jgi:hypothetical protein